MRPVFDDFHLLRMKGDYEYPRHQHTNYELILVDRGPYRCELNGNELTLAKGQVLVIKPGDWHQDHLRTGQRHYVLHFRVPNLQSVGLFRSDISPALQIARGDHDRDALFMRELRRETELDAAYAPAVQDSLLEALFWRVVRDLPSEALSETVRRLPRREALREQIVAVLHGHIGGNPTVRTLAVETRMSPRHLTNLCQTFFGEPPARLLLKLKLRRAEDLLRFREMSVKEVSAELGFANPYHFSRAFRRHHGRAPSRMRDGG